MRTAIWNSMLDSDMNARYWKELVGRYLFRDKCLKIFLAVMASSAVAGWGFWEEFPHVWKGLSSISAVAAIAMPIINYQKDISEMADLAGRWGELRNQYENLWFQVRNNSDEKTMEETYQKYRNMESYLEKKETELPNDKQLLQDCFNEVKKSRGLK